GDASGVITITVGGVKYNATVGSGRALFNISGLTAGKYLIEAIYSGDTYYAEGVNNTVEFTVKTTHSVIVEEMARGYGSGLDYQATFTDEVGNPLANTNVTFAVGGKEYTVMTDANGVAKLNAGIDPGMHTIGVVNPITGEKSYSTLNIVPRLANNTDIVMDFRDGTKYIVRVMGDDGKPVGAGELVVITANNVPYKVKTDKNGYARLNLNLNP
ncbi:MAG: hypothetical protein BZ137_09805, partial [Methanosphaera sp. rholeuAM130]